MQETEVQALGQEDPLKKGIATHSIILACSIPWTEEPGGLQSMGSQSWIWQISFNAYSNRSDFSLIIIYGFHKSLTPIS